ncbi:MAG: SDR family oxidoreductase [Chitinophagales bacterium]
MATRNLVLGGAGMIGSALCDHLLQKGEQVISLDIKTGFDLRADDLNQHKDVDYVWFLAWDVGGSKYLTNKNHLLNIISNNTIICKKVFDFLEETKIPFMFATSQLAASDNVYGVTKLLGEQWTKILNGQLVRFWNVYGWEEPGEKSHIIPDLIFQGLHYDRIELLSNGEEERQFIFMDDCVNQYGNY